MSPILLLSQRSNPLRTRWQGHSTDHKNALHKMWEHGTENWPHRIIRSSQESQPHTDVESLDPTKPAMAMQPLPRRRDHNEHPKQQTEGS